MMLLRSPSLSILLSPSVDTGLQQGITSLRVQYGLFNVHRDRESKKTTGDVVCKNKQYLKTESEQQQQQKKQHWKCCFLPSLWGHVSFYFSIHPPDPHRPDVTQSNTQRGQMVKLTFMTRAAALTAAAPRSQNSTVVGNECKTVFLDTVRAPKDGLKNPCAHLFWSTVEKERVMRNKRSGSSRDKDPDCQQQNR